ncbi:hypothetical protein [Hymenobacter aerophilus]|uniref:hypothetical protein n=1 Tax=Hymenobacter aerophilus TaxID=119644 RepID=UPI00038038FF|nr:hypothetical protein [Hymenobacter aerophilus]
MLRTLKNLRQKIADNAELIWLLPLFFVALILAIPALPFILIYAHLSDKKCQKSYKEYLARMNGTCFFYYNNRKSSFAYIREFLLPALSPSVQVVFVERREVDAGPDGKYLARMLGEVKERKGFPYLLKIMDGQVVECSVNNQFYSIMIGRKPLSPLLDRINAFYNAT